MDSPTLALHFAGTGVGAILASKSRASLHAAAVEADGRAVALVGASASGKSTMAALLCMDGFSLVADDIVSPDDELRVANSATAIRLRDGARGLASLAGWPTTKTVDGRTLTWPQKPMGETRPQLALVVMLERQPTAPREPATQLSPVEAAARLVRHSRLAGLRSTDARRQHLQLCAAVARRIPVVQVVTPAPPDLWSARARQEFSDRIRVLLHGAD